MSFDNIKVVSLFAGIGGFEVGLQQSRIKGKVVFASEIDKNARKSYIANWSSDNFEGDITKVNEKDVPSHDLLLAGFPCQAFSIAGKQRGLEDARGTLFFDVARILNEKKPRYILLENVKNLISHNKTETIKMILKILNDIGYTVDFTVINSCEAGVPQNRDRNYICGIYGLPPEKYNNDIRSLKASALKKELNFTNFNGFNFFNYVKFENQNKYIEDILEKNVDKSFYFETDKIRDYLNTLNIVDKDKRESRIIKLFDFPRYIFNDLERQRRVYSTKGISPTVLARPDTTKILIDDGITKKVRKITAFENFLIQGFDADFVNNIKSVGMSMTQMYKQSGNAVSPPVITGILNYLESKYISVTRDGVVDYAKND